MIFAILLILYLTISLFDDILNPFLVIITATFFMLKWLTDYRKCTISYIECKLRNIKKEDGYVNCILNDIIDLNKLKYRYLLYFYVIIVIYINYIKYVNQLRVYFK